MTPATCSAKGPLRAVGFVAEEPPHQQPDHGLLPTDRRVSEATLEAALHLAGSDTAPGTGSVGMKDARMQFEPYYSPNNLIDG